MNFKKLLFRNKELQAVDVVEVWGVRWTSRDGVYSSDINPEVRVFPTQGEARDFKMALEEAFKLLNITGEKTRVTIKKQEM